MMLFIEVLDWLGVLFVKWFVGGEFNVVYNCVDCYVEVGYGDWVVIYWEGELVGDWCMLIYFDLFVEVFKVVNVFIDFGLVVGDCVVIYLLLIFEVVIVMLVCVWLGIMYSVVFGGFIVVVLQVWIVDV